jgi:hypothetical protein
VIVAGLPAGPFDPEKIRAFYVPVGKGVSWAKGHGITPVPNRRRRDLRGDFSTWHRVRRRRIRGTAGGSRIRILTRKTGATQFASTAALFQKAPTTGIVFGRIQLPSKLNPSAFSCRSRAVLGMPAIGCNKFKPGNYTVLLFSGTEPLFWNVSAEKSRELVDSMFKIIQSDCDEMQKES